MTIPDFILGSVFAAILAMQAWMLSGIVKLKVDVASMKATLDLLKRKL